jgi:hypothetical protein
MISFLSTEIGRGHPFYMDGVVQALEAAGRGDLVARRSDPFAISRGPSAWAWRAVRGAYHVAAQGGALAVLYRNARGTVDYDRDTAFLRVLGRDLRRWVGPRGIVVVDHPSLVGALRGRDDVWYAHGELVVPEEAIAQGAARIFVPRDETAGAFIRGGIHPERVLVTGVCVERGLVPLGFEQMVARRKRLSPSASAPLTIAIFSSGSEPRAHVRAMAIAAAALATAGQRVLVYAVRGGRLEEATRRAHAGTRGLLEVVGYSDRAELDRVTRDRFRVFDVVISPPHERSNWAIALGLPFLLVGPDIGPFAPMNRSLLLRSGVAAEIESDDAARTLPARLAEWRTSGRLLAMAEMGVGVSFRGFDRAAELLIAEAARRDGEFS